MLTLDEIRVAASAIRALPPASPLHGRNTYVGWRFMGGSGSFDADGNTTPCRCVAQAVFEFRYSLSERFPPAELDNNEAKGCYDDLSILLQTMGHNGFLFYHGDIQDALPYFEQIIQAAEAAPSMPVAPMLPSEAVASHQTKEEPLLV